MEGFGNFLKKNGCIGIATSHSLHQNFSRPSNDFHFQGISSNSIHQFSESWKIKELKSHQLTRLSIPSRPMSIGVDFGIFFQDNSNISINPVRF
jgi:hypothetical protein